MLNVKETPIFSRSNQDFYILWIILRKISNYVMETRKDEVKEDIKKMLSLLKNVDEIELDEKYAEKYVKSLNEITKKYNEYNHDIERR